MGRILSPLAGSSKSYVKNSEHFAVKIEITTLNSCDLHVLVSFNVSSLFTKISLDEWPHYYLKTGAWRTEPLFRLQQPFVDSHTELFLHTTYFEFQEDYYKHVDEIAMGSALSPLITNLYMERFKDEALDTAADQPSLCGYVMWMTPLPSDHMDLTNSRSFTATY